MIIFIIDSSVDYSFDSIVSIGCPGCKNLEKKKRQMYIMKKIKAGKN